MPELADILRRHGPEYLRRHGASMPAAHRRAIGAILACRTPERGGHHYRCADCGREHFAFHSCNHRSCPRCGGQDAAKWLERQNASLLPAPYFLVTFTLPEPLRALCRSHPKLFYNLLFAHSAQTLKEVALNPRHLGADIGFLGVLHTWTRQSAYHPHIHYVVPGGGLSAEGTRWKALRAPEFLLPVRVLSARFRNRMGAALREADPALHAGVPAEVWRQPWVVHSQAAGGGGEVLAYLARYVFRTALSNKRLLEDEDGRVTFGYTESATGEQKTLTLDAMEFIRRFLLHVLPQGLHKVRYFGWLHPRAKKRLVQAQTLLAAPLILSTAAEAPPPIHLRCPHCGHTSLILVARIRRARGPPP